MFVLDVLTVFMLRLASWNWRVLKKTLFLMLAADHTPLQRSILSEDPAGQSESSDRSRVLFGSRRAWLRAPPPPYVGTGARLARGCTGGCAHRLFQPLLSPCFCTNAPFRCMSVSFTPPSRQCSRPAVPSSFSKWVTRCRSTPV